MYQKINRNTISKMIARLVIVMGAVCFVFNAPAIQGQGTNGRLVITVKDQSEAVIAGATVKVLNEGTSQEIDGTTNEAGVGIFPQLPVGSYSVTVEVPGFKKAVREKVKLDVGQEYGLTIGLEVGGDSELVTVQAGEELVQTTSAEVKNTVNQKQVQELPINGRGVLQLVQLQAGVAAGGNNAQANAFTVVNGQRAGSATVTQDGINIQDNYLRENSLDFTPNRTTVAQVSEFSVTTQNGDVSVSGGASAIRTVSPSGTNEFHGEVFEYHRNSALGSNDFFNNLQGLEKPQLIQNQFGFTLSGPAIKNKLFFFTFFEGVRTRVGTPQTNTILLPNARQGVFTYRDNSGQTRTINLFGLSDLTPDPTIASLINQLPTDANANTTGDVLNTTGFTVNRAFNTDRNTGGIRVDYNLNASHRFEGIYNRTSEVINRPDADGTFDVISGVTNVVNTHFAVGAWTWSINPRLTNELRIGGNRPEGVFDSKADLNSVFLTLPLITNPVNQFTSQGRTTTPVTIIDGASYTLGSHFMRFGGQLNRVRTNPFSFNNGTPPAFTVGFGVGAPDDVQLTSRDFPGGIDATQLATANNLLALLAGVVSDGQVNYEVTSQTSGYQSGIPNRRNYEYKEYSGYFNDSWRAHPRLTLNLGLRWDYRTPVKERDNLLLTPVLNGRSAREAVLDPNGTYDFVDGFLNNPDRNNFAPNVSFAWDIPRVGRQTVLRAGYSISYVNDQAFIAPINALDTGNDGLRTTVNVADLFGTVSRDVPRFLQTVFAPPQFQVPRTYLQNFLLDNTSAVFAVDENLKTPFFHQWNVSLDRELTNNMVVSVRYVGNKSTNLIRGIDYNQVDVINNGLAADVLRAQSNGFLALAQNGRFDPRFNPNVAGSQQLLVFPKLTAGGLVTNPVILPLIQRGEAGTLAQIYHQFGLAGSVNLVANPNTFVSDVLSNNTESNYHALQVELRHRFSNGLTFQTNYTWSKNLTTSPNVNPQVLFEPLLDNNQPGLEYSRSQTDIPHIYKANVIYELPFGPGKRFNPTNPILRKLAGGWAVTSIVTVQSGSPFSITSGRGTLNRVSRSSNNTATSSLTNEQIKDLIGVFSTPNGLYIIDPKVVGTDGRAVSPDGRGPFAGQVFFNPTSGTVGSLARNAFNNPTFSNWDFSFLKITPITERINTEFRAEFFNFTNHPIFGVGNQNVNSSVFGQIGFQLNSPRVVQLAFKVTF